MSPFCCFLLRASLAYVSLTWNLGNIFLHTSLSAVTDRAQFCFTEQTAKAKCAKTEKNPPNQGADIETAVLSPPPQIRALVWKELYLILQFSLPTMLLFGLSKPFECVSCLLATEHQHWGVEKCGSSLRALSCWMLLLVLLYFRCTISCTHLQIHVGVWPLPFPLPAIASVPFLF